MPLFVRARSYTYLMAMFLSLVSVVDEEPWAHARRMDTLNAMLARAKVPQANRASHRLFLISSRDALYRAHQREVFELLSPCQQAEIVTYQYGPILRRITYFREVSPAFLVDVCRAIQPLMMAPGEVLDRPHTLYVVDKGLLVVEGRVVRQGAFLGVDFMLANDELRAHSFPTVRTRSHGVPPSKGGRA